MLLTAGYELHSKFFDISNETDTLGSIILGAKITTQVARGYSVSADIESAMYTYGLDNLANRGPGGSAFMFSAGVGLVIDLEKLRPDTGQPTLSTKMPVANSKP